MRLDASLIGVLAAGVLIGTLIAAAILYRRSRYRTGTVGQAPNTRGAGSPEHRAVGFPGWSQASALWGSASAMLLWLAVCLVAIGIVAYDKALEHFLATFGTLAPNRVGPLAGVVAVSAVVAAALPLYLPRPASVLRGAALGLITGLVTSYSISLFDLIPDFAVSIIFTSRWSIAVVSLVSAAAAYAVGGALSFFARRYLPPLKTWQQCFGYGVAGTLAVVLFGGAAYWPQVISLSRLYPQNSIAPSAWKGQMVMDHFYGFTLVIEKMQPDGRFTGYMAWESGRRRDFTGKGTGNHLVFEDNEILISAGRIDMWLTATSLTGASENGKAKFLAERVTADVQPQSARAEVPVPPPAASSAPISPPPPAPTVLAPELEDAGPRAAGAETVSRVRSERLCEALGEKTAGMQDGCWIVLALQVRDRSHCGSINDHVIRDDCYAAFGVNEDERGVCEYLSSPDRVAACTQAVGGACAKASKEPGAAGAGCDAARSLRARVKSDWASAGNFSFHGFRKTDVAPQTWAACDAAGASDQGAAAGDWCRLERVRRNDPEARCAMVQAELGNLCNAMITK